LHKSDLAYQITAEYCMKIKSVNSHWNIAQGQNVYHVSSPHPSVRWVQFHQQSILLLEHINSQPDKKNVKAS